MKKTNNRTLVLWICVAFVAVCLAAPNGTIVKSVVGDIGPAWFNVFRFMIVAIVTLPWVIAALRHVRHQKKAWRYAALAGVMYGTAVIGYTSAVHLSQASYVSVIDLSIPVLLMLYSVYFTRERVSKRSFVGIGVAALGGFSIIALPWLLGGGLESHFSLAATLLALLNCATFPLMVIFSRKAHEAGVSLWAVFGITAWIVVGMNVLIAMIAEQPFPGVAVVLQWQVIGAILFSAIIVSLVARLLTVASYEHIGSATVAGLSYIESFLAVLLPILILGEKLTIEMLIGGGLILIGVLIIEVRHAPQLHLHRKHMARHT